MLRTIFAAYERRKQVSFAPNLAKRSVSLWLFLTIEYGHTQRRLRRSTGTKRSGSDEEPYGKQPTPKKEKQKRWRKKRARMEQICLWELPRPKFSWKKKRNQ